MDMDDTAAKRLRAPFPPEAIGKLPRKNKDGRVVHLDYVGHAAVTDRLLEVNPWWYWEPMVLDDHGLPLIQYKGRDAVMWIRLTVLGMTRLGVGICPENTFELEKQLISDAIRNAAMRFGVALDLWSKEDLRAEDDHDHPEPQQPTSSRKLREKAKPDRAPSREDLIAADDYDFLVENAKGLSDEAIEAVRLMRDTLGIERLAEATAEQGKALRNYMERVIQNGPPPANQLPMPDPEPPEPAGP